MCFKSDRIVSCIEKTAGINVYRISGSEKTALIDWGDVPAAFSENIDYLIVNHVLPMQFDNLGRLIEKNPQITVAGAVATLNFIREYTGAQFTPLVVKPTAELDLGGITLKMQAAFNVNRSRHQDRTWKKSYRFLNLPNWQWMDSIFSWCPEEKAVFSGEMFANEDGRMRRYFEDHQRAFPCEARENIDMLRRLTAEFEVESALPATGRAVDLQAGCDSYSRYLEETAERDDYVVIPYVSRFGLTRQMAGEIAAGVMADGVLTAELVEVTDDSIEEAVGKVGRAAGIIAGTPTIEGDAAPEMRKLLAKLTGSRCGGRLAAAFGDFSYTPRGTANVLERMKQLGMRVMDAPYDARFILDDEQMATAFAFGRHFGRCLVRNEILPFIAEPPAEPRPQMDTGRRFLIIGNGAAGTTAAEEIRRYDRTCSIEIIGDEPYSGYNRQVIFKGIFEDLPHSELSIRTDQWFEDNEITPAIGVKALSLDHQGRKAVCSDGRTREYDILILATGAHPAIPPVRGIDADGIFPMYSLEQVHRMHEYVETRDIRNVIILGGGILGLETAAELISDRPGLKITVADSAPHIMRRNADMRAGLLMKEVLEQHGVNVLTEAVLTEIKPEGCADVHRAVFADGTVLEADLIIICTGISENTELLQPAGGPIAVDEQLRAEKYDSIYACGDCAAFRGVNLGLWSQALDMAKIAGANAAGLVRRYQGSTPAVTFTGFGLSFCSIGSIDQLEQEDCAVKESYDPQAKAYQKLYFTEGRFRGAVLVGNVDAAAELIDAWHSSRPMSEIFI